MYRTLLNGCRTDRESGIQFQNVGIFRNKKCLCQKFRGLSLNVVDARFSVSVSIVAWSVCATCVAHADNLVLPVLHIKRRVCVEPCWCVVPCCADVTLAHLVPAARQSQHRIAGTIPTLNSQTKLFSEHFLP